MFDKQMTFPTFPVPSGVDARMGLPMDAARYTAVSLYSGAGGLDLGFARAGIETRWAVDVDRFAVETYNANLEPVAICADVLTVAPPGDLQPDLVIGGPPCQGFSVIGRMDPNDPRSRHVEHFFDVVEELAPRGFVMENVKALAVNARWARTRRMLERRARRLGYEHRLFVLNAKDFGVPQARERMFLVGLRGATPGEPVPTTADRPLTVREALAALPPVGGPGNDLTCAARVVPARAPIMRPSPYQGSLLFNGSGRPLQLDAVAKTVPASMGGNATPIIDQEELVHDRPPWVVRYHRKLAAGGAVVDRVPDRLRRITVQEAAALQSFPADWNFSGPRVAQYRQVGNAVPPKLAEAVAGSVRATLAHLDSTAVAA